MTTTPMAGAGSPGARLTYDTILEALTELVNEDPVRKNPYDDAAAECVYTNPDGTPSCVIGNLMFRLGLPLPDPNDSRAQTASPSEHLYVDDRTADLLASLQEAADQGITWAEALDLALG